MSLGGGRRLVAIQQGDRGGRRENFQKERDKKERKR